nr:hypothetical protein [uncultured bacterium]
MNISSYGFKSRPEYKASQREAFLLKANAILANFEATSKLPYIIALFFFTLKN